MKAAIDELLALEREFWTGGRRFFEENTDNECLVAFSSEMAGVMENKDLAATVDEGRRWKVLDLDLKGTVQPSDNVFLLTYEAKAMRAGGEEYHALVSSGYVRRREGWKMMFHQQTSLPEV
ncbi:MAG TPA: hypothetical protein VNS34_19515 [Rhizobiaceae bacterium]|nr:hypothetical protein [Rhizobiaceae bacterium]